MRYEIVLSSRSLHTWYSMVARVSAWLLLLLNSTAMLRLAKRRQLSHLLEPLEKVLGALAQGLA
jgi:hypothetical protein